MTRHDFQLVLAALLLMAGTTTAQTPPAMDANRWNLDTATPSKPETETAPPSTLNLRVYKDFEGHQPVDGQNPYAVDVSAVMTRCTDGSLIVTALMIGGQLTPLDNRCPNASK
jgi:predicted cobalt transporter CbtA